MCGINGIIRIGKTISESEIISMNQEIKHRGPDDEGVYVSNLSKQEDSNKVQNVGLGHVRLSILDPTEKGHQPMGLTSNGTIIYREKELPKAEIIIVFNGEIYNYVELKKRYGIKTVTGTDTEIILHLYKKLGFDCVKEFNGMWAFAIYDRKREVLFCSRDRLGQKPLYYYFNSKEKEFVFSSELKGILKIKGLNKKENISIEAVELYFSLNSIPAPYTIFKQINKLEARKNLILNLKDFVLDKKNYWKLPDFEPIYDKGKLIEEGRKILYNSVKLRMRSDVPVGAFLSGGLDSSSVVGVMKEYADLRNLHTFSIGFEGKYDETPYINVAKDYFQTRHHHYYFKEKDFMNLIDEYVFCYDEPFADYSGFPTMIVSKIARKNVKVSLSGDGGDEIFGGYNSYINGRRMELLKKIPKIIRMFLSKMPIKKNLQNSQNLYILKEAFKLSLEDDFRFYSKSIQNDMYKPETFKKWTEIRLNYSLLKGGSLSEAFRIYDLLFNTLPDKFLVKVDRASMYYGLEVRSPFLDYRFAEFSQKIPSEWKVDLFKTKKLMREIIKDILPEKILKRGKAGFSSPIKDWILNEDNMKFMKSRILLLKDINEELYEYYNRKVFKHIDFSLYRRDLVSLYLFLRWYERWVNEF